MPIEQPTIPELIALLNRSRLPTVLVEGTSDVRVLRWIEHLLPPTVDILPCGNRDAVVQLFERKSEFASIRVAFLVDRDMDCFADATALPNEIVTTFGFSIENDVFSDCSPTRFLDPREQTKFDRLLDAACRWFAFEVAEYLVGRPSACATPFRRVVDIVSEELRPEFVTERGFSAPAPDLVARIRANYLTEFRGKTLLDVFIAILSAPSRASKFSKQTLLEVCLKSCTGTEKITRLVRSLSARLKIAG